MMQAARFQEPVLAGAGGADDGGADVARDVDRRQPDAAAGVVDQHGLVPGQGAHHHQQLPGREVIDRDRRRLLMAQAGRLAEYLLLGHHHRVGVAAETRQCEYLLALPVGRRTGAGRIDHAGHLVADHAGQPGCIRVEPLAGQDVGEIDAAGAHPDPHFAFPRQRIRRFAQLQPVGTADTGDEDLFHDRSFAGQITAIV
ncbi:MAG: hypothetical protein P4L83_19065 [Nevskia sp.]|nr:hypothetical protein [Nevskia sp.]